MHLIPHLENLKQPTLDNYIKLEIFRNQNIHHKAETLLQISPATWISKRKSGSFYPFEIKLLSDHLLNLTTDQIFYLCINSHIKYST